VKSIGSKAKSLTVLEPRHERGDGYGFFKSINGKLRWVPLAWTGGKKKGHILQCMWSHTRNERSRGKEEFVGGQFAARSNEPHLTIKGLKE